MSTRGNDGWSGKLADPSANDGPFATVARARDAARASLKTNKEPRALRVVLRGGTYYLHSTLELGPEDSGTEQAPVVYGAAPGERVILSGGRRLEDGRCGKVNGRQAWVIDIPEVRDGSLRFRQLFVNGERRPRTRLPKEGEYRIESMPGYTGDFLRSPTTQFVYAPGHIVPGWRNLQDVEVVGITRWLDNRLPIESVNSETRTVTFDRPSLFALVSSAPWGDSTMTPSVYWVENVFEALDTPGQWYLDRPQGRLYYLPRPGEDMATAVIIAPRLLRVLEVVGKADSPVHDLHFEGITFSHTEWQPPADYASSLQAGVEVPGALFFDYAERCVVTGGAIEHIGNCGISVGSVQDFGPSQARGNIIEYNHVHDIGQGMLSDLAAIDTCSTPGSRIRFNRVHDVSRRDYGGWGIYPDQGSHDLLIQNNLLYRCQDGALFAHHTCRLFVPGAWESASGREHSKHERFLEGIHWCRMLRLPTHRPLHVAASQCGSDLSVWRPNSTQLENPHGESVCMVCRGDSRGRLAQPGGGR